MDMKFLEKIENASNMSGYAIFKYLDVHSSQYYGWKDKGRQSMKFEYLSKLAALPNVGWENLGKWIDEEFGK